MRGSRALASVAAGVAAPVQLGAFYNSSAVNETPVPRLGRGWGLDYTPDVHVVSNADFSATYYGPGGLTGVFTRASSTTTAYTSAAGFKSDLVKTSTGWTLTEHASRVKRTFDSAGKLTRVEDRNGNATTVTTTPGSGAFDDVSIQAPAGPASAQTVEVTTNTTGFTELRQFDAVGRRGVGFSRDGNNVGTFFDALGRETLFGYDSAGMLDYIGGPGGPGTSFSWTSDGKVASISQHVDAGGATEAVTRLAYPSATQTLLVDPET